MRGGSWRRSPPNTARVGHSLGLLRQLTIPYFALFNSSSMKIAVRGGGVEPSREIPLDPKFEKINFIRRSFSIPETSKPLWHNRFTYFKNFQRDPPLCDKFKKNSTLVTHFFATSNLEILKKDFLENIKNTEL